MNDPLIAALLVNPISRDDIKNEWKSEFGADDKWDSISITEDEVTPYTDGQDDELITTNAEIMKRIYNTVYVDILSNVDSEPSVMSAKWDVQPLYSSTVLVVTRDVDAQEIDNFLNENVPKHSVLYTYDGPTYGCIDTFAGVAISTKAGRGPFFQFPKDAVTEAMPEEQ